MALWGSATNGQPRCIDARSFKCARSTYTWSTSATSTVAGQRQNGRMYPEVDHHMVDVSDTFDLTIAVGDVFFFQK